MIVKKRINQDFKFEMWNEDQIYQLHQASLEILRNTGVIVYDDEALKLLKDGGAYVKGNLVKIPAWMVEEAIKSAPSKILVTGVDKDKKVCLQQDYVNFGLGTDLPSFTDPYTGEVRPTVLEDIVNVGKVAQKAENIDFVANLGLISDVPQELTDLYSFKVLRNNCGKPNLLTATGYGNMKALIDMAAVNAGGYEELRKNPSMIQYAEPVSPLVNSEDAVQKLLICAEYGIPITYASGIIAGATGPATLAGTLALGNAEGLAGLVMHQLKRKGSPFIYGLVFSVMDMRTTISCYGGPELPMAHTIVGQLGRFYDLPTYGTGGCTDTNIIDAQAGMEAMYSNLLAVLGGTNLVHDNGYLGSGLIGSLEMILLDDEVISFIKRFKNSIDINSETLALDLIDEVGHGGDFLTTEHTLRNFKKETWYPKYLNRKQYLAWEQDGKPTINQKLNKRVINIIEEETPNILSQSQIEQFDEIIEERKKEISINQK